MKRIFALLATMAAPALAHPPANLEAEYNLDANTIDVSMRHFSFTPETHYIESVTVTIGEDTPAEKTFVIEAQGQSDQTNVNVSIDLGESFVAAGSTIKVSAVCNLFGSLTEEFEYTGE